MSTHRKPRKDSKLKSQPEEIQQRIFELYEEHGVDAAGIIHEELLIDTSGAALSRFYSWYQMRKSTEANVESTEALLESIKETAPQLSQEELFQIGQKFFAERALTNEDPKAWAIIQATRRDKEKLELERKKFRVTTCELFLKWYEDTEAKKIASSGKSNREKIEALGQKMFGEDW